MALHMNQVAGEYYIRLSPSGCFQSLPTVAAAPFALSTDSQHILQQTSGALAPAIANQIQQPIIVNTASNASQQGAISLLPVVNQMPILQPSPSASQQFVSVRMPVVTPTGQTIVQAVQIPLQQWVGLNGQLSSPCIVSPQLGNNQQTASVAGSQQHIITSACSDRSVTTIDVNNRKLSSIAETVDEIVQQECGEIR